MKIQLYDVFGDLLDIVETQKFCVSTTNRNRPVPLRQWLVYHQIDIEQWPARGGTENRKTIDIDTMVSGYTRFMLGVPAAVRDVVCFGGSAACKNTGLTLEVPPAELAEWWGWDIILS